MTNEFQEKKLSRRSVTTIAAALILAVGVGYGLSLVGTGLSARSGNSITVTGSAKTSAVADNAVWTLNVSEMSQQVSVAVNKVGTSVDALSKYLIKGGLASDAIEVGGVTTYGNSEYVNGNSTGRIISYQANQNVTIRSKDVQLIKKLSNGMGSLLQTGVNINNYGPQFYVSNLDKLRPQLLAEATVDAKERGLSITKAVDSKLGPVLAVTSGPVQVTQPDSVDASAGGMYDTSSIEKSVSVTVSVSFKVN
jgi:uncharacterized protein